MELETFRALRGPAGQNVIAQISASHDDALSLGSRLRREYPSELVSAAMTQTELRRKAQAKFGDDANHMWFTPEALQQATRATVAQYRAGRLAASDAVSGTAGVLDLGCGIGGDLIAFARAGLRVRGLEADPVRAEMAQANLDALGLAGTVDVGNIEDTERQAGEVAFCDPARRDGRGRIFDMCQMSPSWPVVSALLTGPAVVKTFPGFAHDDVPDGVEAEWISAAGDLVEACLWSGEFAATARRATVLAPGLTAGESLFARSVPAQIGPASQWIAEPDDAVIRAGLVAELAGDVGGWLLDPQLAYVTASEPTSTVFARWFRVIAELPFGEKPLRAALAERDIGKLTVKKRGVDVVPEQFIKRLRLRGAGSGTLMLARVGAGARAFLVEPWAGGT